MKASILSFSARGANLGKSVAGFLETVGYEVAMATMGKYAEETGVPGYEVDYKTTTKEAFANCSCIVFIGATGIAVRAIAPYLKNKLVDPAILNIDERGNFVIPLCATIHLSGSMLKITSCAIALMLMQSINVDFLQMLGFVLMLGVTMVAAPGVPGGAIMAALGILETLLGFEASQQAMMITLYIAMDSFGTACNVTGDGAIAVIMDHVTGKKKGGEKE